VLWQISYYASGRVFSHLMGESVFSLSLDGGTLSLGGGGGLDCKSLSLHGDDVSLLNKISGIKSQTFFTCLFVFGTKYFLLTWSGKILSLHGVGGTSSSHV